MFCWSWVKELPYISPIIKVQLQQFKDLRKTIIQLCPEFIVGKQKERDKSNPDLRQHCVPTGPEKAFYLEILLNPFEEELYLPPLPIDISNGASWNIKDISEKHVVLSGYK